MSNEKSRVAIIGAMAVEVRLLIEALQGHRQEQRGTFICHCGTLNGTEAVVVQCGIGKVNMACVTQMLIDCYQPMVIINCGVAGGLAIDLTVGDVVVGEQLLEHDMDVSPLGYAKGTIPDMSKRDMPTYFKADEQTVQQLLATAQELAQERKVRTGCIVSGDQFVADAALKRRLVEEFHGDAAEMEGASLAHVATLNHTSFAVMRVISDAADGHAPAVYSEFETEAGHFASQIVLEYCRRLATAVC